MDFDCTTCGATLSSPSVTGRFLKKVTSLSEALTQEGKGSGGVMRPEQVVKDWGCGAGSCCSPKALQSAFLTYAVM